MQISESSLESMQSKSLGVCLKKIHDSELEPLDYDTEGFLFFDPPN